MPLMRDDENLEKWNLAIEDALEYRRLYGRETEWAKCEALFYQAHETQKQNVGSNIISSIGDALLSTLMIPNPFFSVSPRRQELVNLAPVLEAQLNSFVPTLQLKRMGIAAGTSAYLYGKGIIKIGYDSEFGYTPEVDLGAEQNVALGLSLSQFTKKGTRIEFNQSVQPGMPWVNDVLPHDFLVPFGVRELSSSPWCAHRIIRHIDDIKADRKYSNTKDLVPTLSMGDWVKSYMSVMKPYRMGQTLWNGRREESDAAEYVEMWEIHNARTGRIMVLAQGHPKWLRNDVDYMMVDGLPFIDLTFVPKSRCFWVTPDTVYLQNAQSEIIDIAHMTRHQRRVSLLRFGYKKGAIKRDEMQKFLNGDIGVAFEIDDAGGDDPRNAIFPFTPSNSNNQLNLEAEQIRKDARESVGYGRNQVGETNAGRPTATEISIANNRAETRMDRRIDAVAEMYRDLGRKLAKTVFTFWKTPRLVQMLGEQGTVEWQAFTGSSLKGDYAYDVGFSSEPVDTYQARLQRAAMWFQTLAMDPTIDPVALRRMLVNAVNRPEFTALFRPGIVTGGPNNANLSALLSQLSSGMGGGDTGGGNVGTGGGGREVSVSEVPGSQSAPVRRNVPQGISVGQ